ncbi:MAG: hypothetical protein INR62_02660 [Rhodospirillales bacterium]|nr:hypothetical protein [Acetobacter sp.]
MQSIFSLTEYKMLYPDATEFPTLSQNGLLAVLLEKRRIKAVRRALRQAKRQARRQAVRAWFSRQWAKLRITISQLANPVFVGTTRNT